MELPSEIVDQIAAKYVVQETLEEIQHMRSLYEWEGFTALSARHAAIDRVCRGSHKTYETAFSRSCLYDIESLLNLRLISRQWNFAVSRLLHKHLWWNIHFDNKQTFERAVECCDGQDGGPSRLIRNLNIDAMDDLRTFDRMYSYDNALSGLGVDDDDIILNTYVDQVRPVDIYSTRTNYELHYDKNEEHTLLRHLFDQLTSIEGFSVTFPSAGSNHDFKAQCYDMQGVEEAMATILYGLRSPAFQNLMNLSLVVPSTWHVGHLANGLSQDTRDRLKKLRLVIMDETGPSGSPEYTRTEEENGDGTATSILGSGHAPSNVQVAHPNREHQGALWAFVSSCRNLESLAIEATHYLELDRLEWNPTPGHRGLRDVSLHRVYTNVSSILKLLSIVPKSKIPPAARRVNLDDVKIYEGGGNWEDVFIRLRTRCPDLELFRADQLTYFSDHPRFEHNNRPWENHDDVWTEYGAEDNHDKKYIRMLNKELIEKAGGPEQYPVSIYEYESEDEQ